MSIAKALPPTETIKSLLWYDPNTGLFRWKTTSKSRKLPWTIAGSINRQGYVFIGIGEKQYAAHRLAYKYMTGHDTHLEIDHINMIKNDNRWSNLRIATRSENQWNSKKLNTNTSGFTGVSWHKYSNRWRSIVHINNKQKHLGYFFEKNEAIDAVVMFKKNMHGEFLCHDIKKMEKA